MQSISIPAFAKINLTLDVTGKRPNGYHDVRMVMQQIDLQDTITLTKIETGIELTTDSAFLPTDSSNIAYKAAKAIFESRQVAGGVKIHIEKRIPVAAGLAGGSTDAAAVIKGLNKLYDLNMSVQEMMDLGVGIGADVPFCILGGTALAEGIGEKLTLIENKNVFWMVLSKPGLGVSTKRVYEALNYLEIREHPETEAMIEAVRAGELSKISEGLVNVLEPVTLSLYPAVGQLKAKMKSYGACGVLMSGSGPSVFGLFKSYDRAVVAAKRLKRMYKQTYVTKTITGGDGHE